MNEAYEEHSPEETETPEINLEDFEEAVSQALPWRKGALKELVAASLREALEALPDFVPEKKSVSPREVAEEAARAAMEPVLRELAYSSYREEQKRFQAKLAHIIQRDMAAASDYERSQIAFRQSLAGLPQEEVEKAVAEYSGNRPRPKPTVIEEAPLPDPDRLLPDYQRLADMASALIRSKLEEQAERLARPTIITAAGYPRP